MYVPVWSICSALLLAGPKNRAAAALPVLGYCIRKLITSSTGPLFIFDKHAK